jgi:uncharacterized protein DUF6545
VISTLFTVLALTLFAAAGYWMRRRDGERPVGARTMAGVLVAFGLAFLSYTQVVRTVAEAVVPHGDRLLSNSFTLVAATTVLAFLRRLEVGREAARRTLRRQLAVLLAALAAMTVFFAVEQAAGGTSRIYALYVLVYTGYLTFSVLEFLRGIWRQAARTRRRTQRIGLRVSAVGCGFALAYTAYKIVVLTSVGLRLGLLAEHGPLCSSPVTPVRCAFSVTAPAAAVLTIALGLTLPALAWPVEQHLRRRWEARSFAALGPLWADITAVTPHVVLDPPEPGAESGRGTDLEFLLHRRVVEIDDGLLTLRPYRSRAVRETARRTATAGTRPGRHTDVEAAVEAAVLRAAVAARRAGAAPAQDAEDSLAHGPSDRGGGLRAETEWLLRVAAAYRAAVPAADDASDSLI